MFRKYHVCVVALAAVLTGCAADEAADGVDDHVGQASSGLSSVGGRISRAEILRRAQYWVDLGVPYSSSEHSDGTGGKYRSDCSGYVSMAWHLKNQLDTAGFVDSSLKSYIGYDDLRPGDALLVHNSENKHIELFDRWTSGDHTAMWIYSESGHGQVAKHVTRSLSYYKEIGFRPIRYTKVVEPADPTPGGPADPPAKDRIGVVASNGHFLVKEGGLSAGWTDEHADVTAGVLDGDRIGVIANGHFLVKDGALNASWVDEYANVTAAALAGDRIGVLANGHFFVKEGGLSAAWVDEYANVTAGFLDGDRIGVISDGHLLVKDGGLSASWVDEHADVTDAMLENNRIGVITGGHLLVKDGGLSASWVDEHADVVAAKLAGDRIGVLLTNGHFLVKEGALNASWVDEYSGVAAGALTGN